jgi:hypothetical protein
MGQSIYLSSLLFEYMINGSKNKWLAQQLRTKQVIISY